jgi:diguanylate cyclase (GGDEF)-like protein
MDALPGGVVFALALAAVAVIGMADELTGSKVSLTLFYLAPVWFAAWFLGARPGIVVALAAAIAGWAADVATRLYAPRPGVVAANLALQLLLFATAAAISAHVRGRGDRESILVRTDGLTGLLNRRGFLEVARREIARSGRTGHPLTVALLDVDGFREVNAARGHEAGDLLLGGLGAALRSSLRAVDASARLAGNEFAVLLPDTDPSSVGSVLDRLRLVLLQAAAEKGAPLSISLGAATFQRPPATLDEMLRAAARMLAAARTNGAGGFQHGMAEDSSTLDVLTPTHEHADRS